MLHLHLFGAPSVRAGGLPVGGAAAQPRRLALLALLARAGDRGITRDKVIGTLWPEQDEEKSRRALTHALYALRRDLGSEDAIEGSRDLRFNPALVTSDLADFLLARAEGRLGDAVAAYAGPLMDGFHVPDAPEFERWLDTERLSLAVDYSELLERMAEAAGKSGDARAAAGWWRKRAALDPLDARIALALMGALAESGDTGAALRHAAVFESLLEQELGLPQEHAVAEFAARLRTRPPAVPDAPRVVAAAPAPVKAAPPAAPSSKEVNLYDGYYGRLGTEALAEVRRATYDEDLGQASWITAAEARDFFTALELAPGSNALEVACGSGGMTCRMAQDTGAACVGVDINTHGIAAAQQRAAEQKLFTVSFRVCDAGQRLPFVDGSFDALFCNDSINHFPGRSAVFRDWHRVLKPGGRLLFTDPIVVTGQLTNEEMRERSSIGYFLFTPQGHNEKLLAEAGFAVRAVRDVTDNVALVSGRWRAAREQRRAALVELEGEESFESLQRFLGAVHTLSSERRLSRFMYLAARPV